MNEFFLTREMEHFNIAELKGEFMPAPVYTEKHKNSVIACHDIYINVPNADGERGLILVVRQGEPAKGMLWPIGGEIRRGLSMADSLRKKVKDEAGLDLEGEIKDIGWGYVGFPEDPFGHGRGTSAIGLNFYSRGAGQVNLDRLHDNPTIVTPAQYRTMKRTFHPYVACFMDKAMRLLQSS